MGDNFMSCIRSEVPHLFEQAAEQITNIADRKKTIGNFMWQMA